MIDFTARSTQDELMDNFKGSKEELDLVLKDINKVNTILGGNRITLNAVFQLLKKHSKKSYTILDMGCAEGTILRKLALEARKRKIVLKLIGIDLNGTALQLAKSNSKDFPEISYIEGNVLTTDFKEMEIDVVITTLTMHHFTNKDILMFVRRFTALTKVGVVINDLQRSKLAYYLFKIFSFFFITSKTAKIDGLISISKALKRKEIESLAEELPHVKHTIKWKWAFRYVWLIENNRLK